jgi:predicted nucleic acid-binding protein
VIIVDASVVVKWVIEEPARELALRVLEVDVILVAPDLLFAEFASVIRKKLRSGQITPEQINPALAFLRDSITTFIPTDHLVDDALILANQINHSPYDCIYLACALSRGYLVTADEKFIAKCQSNGFGDLVFNLYDLTDGRVAALLAHTIVGPTVLADISRLTPLISQTFHHLGEMASADQSGKFRIFPTQAVAPAFGSPAYLKLEQSIRNLSGEQIAFLLALGWLGRDYHHGSDWVQLIANAREGSLVGDFNQHKSYIMAQMNAVPAGLAKLRSYFDIQA